jgi:hypothetical protein
MQPDRLKDAAFSLILRSRTLPFGKQVLLSGLVTQAMAIPSIDLLWELLERMDRLQCFSPESYRHHRADLRRLEFLKVDFACSTNHNESGGVTNESVQIRATGQGH